MSSSQSNKYRQLVSQLRSTSDPSEQFAVYCSLKSLAKNFSMLPMHPPPNLAARQNESNQIEEAQVLEHLLFAINNSFAALHLKQNVSMFTIFTAFEALCNFLIHNESLKRKFLTIQQAIPCLINFLGYPNNEQFRIYAARCIWIICQDNSTAKDKIASANGLQVLQQLIQVDLKTLRDTFQLEMAIGAIQALASDHPQNKLRFRHLKTIHMILRILITYINSSDRLVYLCCGALASLCWNYTENQDHLSELENGAIWNCLRTILVSKKFTLLDKIKIGSMSVDQHLLSQVTELISALCLRNRKNRLTIKQTDLVPSLIGLLSNKSTAIRTQVCSAIYSICIDDPELAEFVGSTHKGVASLCDLSKDKVLMEFFSAFIALGSLLKRCPPCQNIFSVLHQQKVFDIRVELERLIKAVANNPARIPSVLEAMYNICSEFPMGRVIIASPSVGAINLLFHILSSPAHNSATRILAADTFRVCSFALPNLINKETFAKLVDLMLNSGDPELQKALAGCVASLAIPTNKNQENPFFISLLHNTKVTESLLKSASIMRTEGSSQS